ncbi:amidase signature domain-containing protein [Cercophora newfieldiana]|uniref:Amidase signature domain-containing protein n=1 Tax=Cercophora newfieldiana TaxID=92897 RepID=A0AA39Y141_9PEZI|nr:amidase signature domain-containing protein [Cercophora newfieldiana]
MGSRNGPVDPPPLLQLTIEKAADGLKSGNFTSLQLTKAYLARIEEASCFKAVLQLNPNALYIAQQLDEERAVSGPRSPLHGIPLLVKDNIAVHDKGLDVLAGSFALLGARPINESSVIEKLREAGVVILGKTNMSEWANFRGLEVSSGWSPRGGQTLGVYYPDSSPSGSSSGSAVAVALGLSVAALGTEPSRGLVANDGTIPISSRQDVVGTLSRTVKDAAFLLNAMAGRSDRDDRTWSIPFYPLPDFTKFCIGTNLTGVSIGVPRNTFSLDPTSPVMTSFELALGTLAAAGAKIVDNANFSAADEFSKLSQQVKGIVRSSEFKKDVVRYLQGLATNPRKITSAEDIIKFTQTYPGEEYPDRDIGKFLWTQEQGIDVDSDKYRDMVEKEKFFGGEGGILGALKKFKVDAFVVPSYAGIGLDLAAKMGFPELAVPLGFYPEETPVEHDSNKPHLVEVAPGIPYSMTFFSKAFSEDVLFRIGHAFEQLAAVRDKAP